MSVTAKMPVSTKDDTEKHGGVAADNKTFVAVESTGVRAYVITFTCSYCNKTFSSVSRMKTHERVHTGEKPFTCSVCDMKFSQGGNLKAHMRVHTGEKPFACTVCMEEFSYLYRLKSHMRVHTS